MKALIIINFKTYQESYGKKSLGLAKKISKARSNGYEIAISPSLLTTKEIIDKTNLIVYSQHTDHVNLGPHTGRIPAKELKQIGARGTILNHSERKIPLRFLKEIIESCKKNKLKTVVCASTLSEIKKIAQMHPNYIAYEPKELIGGNVSVTESNPDIIVKAIELVSQISPRTKILCGAGIHSKEDLGHALLLGTNGVLIGHAASKSKDPKKFLESILL